MTAFDALRVSLPVGTVSGAPKVRAMQIIDELEPTRRGPYGGAVGYLDFAGNMDTCIALRTIVWQERHLRRAGRRRRRRRLRPRQRVRRDDEQGQGDAQGGGDRGRGFSSIFISDVACTRSGGNSLGSRPR